jgi:putative membrane protein
VREGKFRFVIVAALGLALALALYFVLTVGVGVVFSAVIAVGWGGFAILCLYALGLFLPLGAAWYVLVPASGAGFGVFVWARMVRDAATEVLPFSHLGGIVLGARAAILHGISQPRVFASMIVDVTTETLAQLCYIALGVVILSASAPRAPFTASPATVLAVCLALAAAAGGLFLAMRRYGNWMTGKLVSRLFPQGVGATTAVAAALQSIHGSPARIGLSLALHFSGWIASAVGTWIAFRLMGARVGLAPVLAIESLVYATRSAAALVPNALGVQEAAYALLTPLFDIGAEFGLAVSLLKRARDIAVGVPILLIWQGLEGRRALSRARSI